MMISQNLNGNFLHLLTGLDYSLQPT